MENLSKIHVGNCNKTYLLLIQRFHDSYATLVLLYQGPHPSLQMSVLSLASLLQSLPLLANVEKCSSVSHLCEQMALLWMRASFHVLEMSAKYMFF